MLVQPGDKLAVPPFPSSIAVLRNAACKLAISSAAEIPFPLMSASAIPIRRGLSRMKS